MRATSGCRTTSASVNRTIADAVDAAQRLERVGAGPSARRAADRPGIGSPVTDHARALAEPRQEHLHLHRRRVLRLVEDDEGVRQRAAAHEGDRRDLDLAAAEPLRRAGRPAACRCSASIDRPQIGIDLLAQIAGQEAQPLAGLDRRARQDDALDRAGSSAGRPRRRPRDRSCRCRPAQGRTPARSRASP